VEGPTDNHFPYCTVFFILGAGEQLFHNLKETAVCMTMRTSNSLSYLLNIPIKELLEIIEIIIKTDCEIKERVKENRKRR